MNVLIEKDGLQRVCLSKRQLDRYKAEGWTEVKPKPEPKAKN